jgi:hypothetical protein
MQNVKRRVEAIRHNARNFLAASDKLHEKMSKDQRKSLQERRKYLVKNVNDFRRDFRKGQREIKTDLAEASKIWSRMNESLRNIKEI